MYEADIRKKTKTSAFADFLSRVMSPGQGTKVSPPPPLLPTLPRLHRGKQTDVTTASVTSSTYRL